MIKAYPIINDDQKNLFIRIYNGNLLITKNMLNMLFLVYNGRFFIPIRIIDSMVGFKFKMFSFSKKILLKKAQKIYKKNKK
jgi:ribosomal protein S19